MRWPSLSRQEWVVLVILDTCAIWTTLYGVGKLVSLKSDNLFGVVFVITGLGVLWYVSRPILGYESPEEKTIGEERRF